MKKCFTPFLLLAFFPFTINQTLQADETTKPKLAVAEVHLTKQFGISPLITISADKEKANLAEQIINALNQNTSIEAIKAPSENADYLIQADVQSIEISTQGNHASTFSYQIIDQKTSKVLSAKKFTITLDTSITTSSDNKITTKEILDLLNNKIACIAAHNIYETLFPIKIATVQEGYVSLDHGTEYNLQRDTLLHVFIPNTPVIDEKNHELIKDSEYEIGELKVTESQPNFAKAQVLNFSIPMQPGMLCRTSAMCK